MESYVYIVQILAANPNESLTFNPFQIFFIGAIFPLDTAQYIKEWSLQQEAKLLTNLLYNWYKE